MKEFKLENEPKIESGFKTPDHYFENFSSKIMLQLPQEEPKVISIFQKRKAVLMMVAAVLILALMVPIYLTFTAKDVELDQTAIESYLVYESNMNQYDLISVLETDDINKIKTETVVLEDETIEDFLSSNSNIENLLIE
jgi:hypothetical protein